MDTADLLGSVRFGREISHVTVFFKTAIGHGKPMT